MRKSNIGLNLYSKKYALSMLGISRGITPQPYGIIHTWFTVRTQHTPDRLNQWLPVLAKSKDYTTEEFATPSFSTSFQVR
jgi:hypothetical protein